MFRFFVQEKQGNFFALSKETLKHIRVSRVKDRFFICVYQGQFYKCKLENGQAKIIEKLDDNHELQGYVTIVAAIIDTKRFEWMIQKATELGISTIIPMYSHNVQKKVSGDINKKIERWNTIAQNAAEQSFRNFTLKVQQPITFDQAIELKCQNRYIAHEKKSLDTDQFFPTHSLFLVGPEGGFTDEEISKASVKGFNIISLGPRILRAETASLFIASRIKQ